MAKAAKNKTTAASKKNRKPSKSLTQQAYEEIKNKLLLAKYPPGHFLQEAAICADLNMGRTPVHQALHMLNQEGLVQIIPRKGILVKMMSLDELYTALEARILVEPYCAAQCAAKATEAEKKRIAAIHGKYEKLSGGSDPQKLMQIDREFHAAISEIGGNPLLTEFLRPLHEKLIRSWLLPQWQVVDFDLTGAEHTDIVNAITAGDASEAFAAMRRHIQSLLNRMGFSIEAPVCEFPNIKKSKAVAAK